MDLLQHRQLLTEVSTPLLFLQNFLHGWDTFEVGETTTTSSCSRRAHCNSPTFTSPLPRAARPPHRNLRWEEWKHLCKPPSALDKHRSSTEWIRCQLCDVFHRSQHVLSCPCPATSSRRNSEPETDPKSNFQVPSFTKHSSFFPRNVALNGIKSDPTYVYLTLTRK